MHHQKSKGGVPVWGTSLDGEPLRLLDNLGGLDCAVAVAGDHDIHAVIGFVAGDALGVVIGPAHLVAVVDLVNACRDVGPVDESFYHIVHGSGVVAQGAHAGLPVVEAYQELDVGTLGGSKGD